MHRTSHTLSLSQLANSKLSGVGQTHLTRCQAWITMSLIVIQAWRELISPHFFASEFRWLFPYILRAHRLR